MKFIWHLVVVASWATLRSLPPNEAMVAFVSIDIEELEMMRDERCGYEGLFILIKGCCLLMTSIVVGGFGRGGNLPKAA